MRALGASRTSLVPGGVLAGPWVRDDLWRRARAVPSLDLRFADNKSLVDAVTGASLVTFTRASDGTFTNSAGVLQTAATDVPRFDHNPITGESLGLLVEEQRTNSIVNSNSITAVVTGSPGTLPTGFSAQGNSNGWTREVIGSGSIGALNYVDVRFFGTPTGTQFGFIFQSQGVVAASNGQSWSPSVYHQLVGGSMSGISSFAAANLWNSSAAFIGSLTTLPNVLTPTSTLQRFTGTGTIGLAATAFINWGITFTNTAGSTYDFTIRFAGPQLEVGASPSTYIPTTTAAVTRSADVASITGSAFSGWYRQDEGTVFAETRAAGATNLNGISGGAACFSNGTSTERIRVSIAAIQAVWISGNTTQATLSSGTGLVVNALFRAAAATRANDFAFTINANAVQSSLSGSVPSVSELSIGASSPAVGFLNGTIRRLTFWPQRLPNNVLQAITQ